jgi:UDP-N-acetylmuramate dehydrogenase
MSTKSTPNSSVNLDKIISSIGADRIKKNFPLSQITWMKVGGPADVFFVSHTKQDLIDIVSLCIKYDQKFTVLGGGSNILIKDGGIRGVVIQNKCNKISLVGIKGGVVNKKTGISSVSLKAESGAFVNALVRYSIDESLEGLEEFLGIPGTVGGAVFNNSHHLDHLIGDNIVEVEVIGKDGEIKSYSQAKMKFGYDYSILHQTKEVVLSATFKLSLGDNQKLWQKAEAALKRRRDSQPLEVPSSGCMFKNIGQSQAFQFNTPDHQTSAGFLIDKAGLKGKQIGGAQVSQVHANFIVNTGNATAADIIKLKDFVAKSVKDKFGVTLETEVFFIGED